MAYEIPEDGWIRLWRRLLEKRIWKESKPKHKVIITTLLLMVNFEPREDTWNGKEITLKAGQMIVSLDDIQKAAGIEISVQNVRTALDNFEKKFEFITQQSTNAGRLITILNWNEYQHDGLTAQQTEQQKENAEKLYQYYVVKIQPASNRKTKGRAINNILKHAKKYEFRDMAKAILNYQPKAMAYDREFRKDPANFFGVNEPYFKDFLPGAYRKEDHQNGHESDYRSAPDLLTPEKLQELNA